jgi:inositol transport system ATP-binding protein
LRQGRSAKSTNSSRAALEGGHDPLTPAYSLSIAEQQMVEIARALTMNAKLIILDEPTAALSDWEVEKLHQIVRDLKAHGISIIYVTHRLGEVKQICDRLTVFRDGKYAGDAEVADTSIDQIVRMMVGRNVEYLPVSTTGAVRCLRAWRVSRV